MKVNISMMHIASILILTTVFSCTKTDPELVDEQELITSVILTFTSDGEEDQQVRWTTQLNENPTITLNSNSEYEVAVSFLDESDLTDVEDITTEVKMEADEHQVFFEFSGVPIEFGQAVSDVLDTNQNPLYINSLWSTSSPGSGAVRVYLIHEPIQKNSSDRNGFGGETDVEVDFSILVKD
ncbi:hypothetical protein N9H89_03355 [Flavobacteriaceae bacterium]|nr:hypothetical protein [Flavobacteriaceae bacterium]